MNPRLLMILSAKPSRPPAQIMALFANGEPGSIFVPSLVKYAWQDSGKTVRAVVGMPVVKMVCPATGVEATFANVTLQQDEAGKLYLSANGTTSAGQTGSINFSGTSRATVFAGVYKASDAAAGVVCELTSNTNTLDGSFDVLAPGAAAASTYRGEIRGTVAVAGVSSTGFAAPTRNVLTYEFDTAGSGTGATAQIRPRVNGVAKTNASGTTAGNFANASLNILARGNGASLPLNGRLYGLIVRGAACTIGQITDAEAYINSLTGAY